MKDTCPIALVEDHLLFRAGLRSLLLTDKFEIVIEAGNGLDLIEKLKSVKKSSFPEIFIVDIMMPLMDGFETVLWLNENFPQSKVIVLTMQDNPAVVMRMLKLNVKSYLVKSIEPNELLKAINQVKIDKFYFNNDVISVLMSSIRNKNHLEQNVIQLSDFTEREIQFLKLSCSDLTYAEIAQTMDISQRTVDAYRNSVFEKLNVKSRTGLALEAIRLRLVNLNE